MQQLEMFSWEEMMHPSRVWMQQLGKMVEIHPQDITAGTILPGVIDSDKIKINGTITTGHLNVEPTIVCREGPRRIRTSGCFGPSLKELGIQKHCLTYCGDGVCDCGVNLNHFGL